MQKQRIQILSTRKLTDSAFAHLHDMGFDVDAFDFISVHPVNSDAIHEQIRAFSVHEATVIFTRQGTFDPYHGNLFQILARPFFR